MDNLYWYDGWWTTRGGITLSLRHPLQQWCYSTWFFHHIPDGSCMWCKPMESRCINLKRWNCHGSVPLQDLHVYPDAAHRYSVYFLHFKHQDVSLIVRAASFAAGLLCFPTLTFFSFIVDFVLSVKFVLIVHFVLITCRTWILGSLRVPLTGHPTGMGHISSTLQWARVTVDLSGNHARPISQWTHMTCVNELKETSCWVHAWFAVHIKM